MDNFDTGIIISFLIISVVALFIPLLIYLTRRAILKSSRQKSRYSAVSSVLIFSACFIASVWCIRYAVGYYSIVTSESSTGSLTWYEEIFNSMVHTFQTFSMDEDYTGYISTGKVMLEEIFGTGSVFVGLYGIYASLLNFIAPIIGGAIIFDILASIFPKIRLRFSFLALIREKYYFSKLNDASLALAESICKISCFSFNKPVIVFTDASFDEDDEKGSELLFKAKSLGAVCVIDDLTHIKKNRLGTRRFFIMDEDDSECLSVLSRLTDENNGKYLKGSEIYLFTSDDTFVEFEPKIYDKLASEFGFTAEDMPTIIPINSYNNLVSSLLVEIPLYEPLINKPREKDNTRNLTLTVIGAGRIGLEMFMTSYWLGQMLDCNFKINIISGESEDEFYDKIDFINPEIKRTTVPNDSILKINRKGDTAKVYCELNYIQCNAQSSDFIRCLTDDGGNITDTDYFFIALGSDSENISVANTVKKYIGTRHINSDLHLNTVITYVVYDTELSDTLNRKRYYSFRHDTPDIYMQAVGNLRDVYSIKNIFVPRYNPLAEFANEAFSSVQDRDGRADMQRNRINDIYKYRDNIAKLLHLKYKIYSMDMFSSSLFDFEDADDAYCEEIMKDYYKYKKAVSGDISFDSPEKEKEHLALLHRMSWLEHRRWNAYMRVQGFSCAADYNSYATPGVKGSFIRNDLKLHPCLVECDTDGIKAEVSYNGIIDEKTLFCRKPGEDFDLLDELSYELHDKKLNDCDFKQYDYPISTVL